MDAALPTSTPFHLTDTDTDTATEERTPLRLDVVSDDVGVSKSSIVSCRGKVASGSGGRSKATR